MKRGISQKEDNFDDSQSNHQLKKTKPNQSDSTSFQENGKYLFISNFMFIFFFKNGDLFYSMDHSEQWNKRSNEQNALEIQFSL